jgi:hypothetical protein
MKTTPPPSMQSQSFQAWRETIAEELNATRERIASLELTTAIWRSNNPRRDRCERSWA